MTVLNPSSARQTLLFSRLATTQGKKQSSSFISQDISTVATATPRPNIAATTDTHTNIIGFNVE